MDASEDNVNTAAYEVILHLYERTRFIDNGIQPSLTAEDKNSIRNSWANLLCGTDVYVEVYLKAMERMIQDHPECKEFYQFTRNSPMEYMKYNSRGIVACMQLHHFLSKVISNLDNLEDVVTMVKMSGFRHGRRGYQIPKTTMPYIGDALLSVLQESHSWTQDACSAYKKLLDWIGHHMICGMDEYDMCNEFVIKNADEYKRDASE